MSVRVVIPAGRVYGCQTVLSEVTPVNYGAAAGYASVRCRRFECRCTCGRVSSLFLLALARTPAPRSCMKCRVRPRKPVVAA